MTGLVEAGHKANFYYRLIAGNSGFGLNYELYSCLQMAQFL